MNDLDKNPFVKNTHCRVCEAELDQSKGFHQLRKYCSEKCKQIHRIELSKERSRKESIKRANEKNSFQVKILEEPEKCREDLRDTLISLNLINFNTKSASTKSNARIKLLHKIKELGIESKNVIMFQEVDIFVNKVRRTILRKYNTIHITPNNFYKLMDYNREMYQKHKTYTHLHAYENIIEDTIIFNDYVNSLEIVESKIKKTK